MTDRDYETTLDLYGVSLRVLFCTDEWDDGSPCIVSVFAGAKDITPLFEAHRPLEEALYDELNLWLKAQKDEAKLERALSNMEEKRYYVELAVM